MAVENICHVPIAAAGQEPLGLVSQHDVICATHSFVDVSLDQFLKFEAAQAFLEQIMLTAVCTTTAGSSLRQAALVLQGYCRVVCW
jgi:hypothetical protein